MMSFGKFIFWTIGFIMQDAGLNGTKIDPAMSHFLNSKEDTSIVPVYSGTSRGTAFFIEYKGNKYLITAAHVCGTSEVMVSPRGVHRVLASRPDKDICIASTYQGVTTLPIGSDALPGEAVVMNGFPGQLEYDVQKGIAKDVSLSMFQIPAGYYDAAEGSICAQYTVPSVDGASCTVAVTTTTLDILARGGNSGGPVVRESDGAVVAIIIGTDGKQGYAAPVSELLGLFEGRP